MGVYIKGMEMPTRCCECRLSTCHSFKERPLCDVLVEYMSYGEWEAKRLDNCPLVPIQPHGNLIDQNENRDEFMNGVYALCNDDPDNYRANAIIDLYDDIPTIIPADPPKEET